MNFKYIFQERLEALPELVARSLQQQQERAEQKRHFLHPDTAALAPPAAYPPAATPLPLPHSR